MINPEIGKKYFQKLEYNRPCGDMFLKEKPENGFRIFVLGSSTVLGFPYNQNVMFSRILQDRLQDCYPNKKIEVVNTAITAINSFTLLDFTDDVLKENPDAILIYAGHNEFYGALGIGSVEKTINSRRLTLLHLDLLSFKLYQLMRNAISKAGGKLTGDNPQESVRETLMKRIAGNKEIAYKSKIYHKGIECYRKNIDQILKKAENKNIPVFISELCSNVKDLTPFCSVEADDYPLALETYQDAIQSEKNGRYDKARELYYMAKDLDCIRFRASEDLNDIIHQLAEKYQACLVPMKENYFEEASPNKLIGNNLMTEHVHPNIDGYFLMADAFFNELAKSNILGYECNAAFYKNSSYYQKNWGYTELDSLVGNHLVNILRAYWPFQSLESSSEHYRNTYQPLSLVDSLAFAVATLPSYRIDEAHLEMADFYMKKGDFYKAFKEYYSNIKFDPFQIRDYKNAIHCLTLINDLPLALKLVDRSLELKETFYAHYVKSEILFLKGDYTGSIKSLDRASNLDNSPVAQLQILISLHKIYHYTGNKARADEILAKLKKINPEYRPVYPEKRKGYVYYIPLQVEDQINEALAYYRSKNFDTALDLFMKSLEIKETALANRCIGDILAFRNDSSSMIYYEKAYPDYNSNISFLYNMELLYLKYKKTDKAEKIYEEIKQVDPGFEKIHILEQRIQELKH